MVKRELIDRFRHERVLVAKGFLWIAGVDEAGRGPLAGPVVAAAVVFPVAWIEGGLPRELQGLNDSKQLSAAQREEYYGALVGLGEVAFSIAKTEAPEIDRINILQATHRAMRQALSGLAVRPQHVLVDGLAVPSLEHPHTPIVKGDSLSYSIAGASVLAKVTRDRLMVEYDKVYPGFGFATNKGYGTKDHLEALRRLGPCPLHRRSFAPLTPVQLELI